MDELKQQLINANRHRQHAIDEARKYNPNHTQFAEWCAVAAEWDMEIERLSRLLPVDEPTAEQRRAEYAGGWDELG